MNGKGRIITADTESVGLLWDMREGHPEDMHIIHCKDFETGERFTFFDDFDQRINAVWLDDYEAGFKAGSIEEGIELLETCEVLIMHNVSGFDALAIEKSCGHFNRNHFEDRSKDSKYSSIMPYRTMDTAVMSRVLNPERQLPGQAYTMGIKLPGPHTIESHGIRIGRFKPDHEDWTRLTIDMIHRCSEDVEIGEDYFKYLARTEWKEQMARPNGLTGLDIRNAYYCELRMAFAVARQEQRGFAVDVALMNKLITEMDEKIITVEQAFRPNMPQRIKMKKLTPAQIEGLVNAMAAEVGVPLSLQYELDMEKLDGRGSYATTYWKLTTAKGAYLKNVTKYIPKARGDRHEYGDNPPVHGAFTPLVWEDIPLGNRDQVKQLLYKFGWKGVNYNDTELEYIENNNGALPFPWSGKIDADSMEQWEQTGADIPDWCRGIAEWYIINSRRNQILNQKDPEFYDKNKAWPRQTGGKNECRGLLANAINFDPHSVWYQKTAQEFYEQKGHWPVKGHWRVPAKAFHAATNTFRMRHKIVVNIPSRGLYGKEMRQIFIAGPGNVLLGCDGAGLELRMLAHFMNDPEYQDIILNGDIHTHNQNLAGLPTRDMAKTFVYATLYGSGIPNLSRQMNLDLHQTEQSVEKFKRELPTLTNLLERVEEAAKKFGYLLAVDGRWGRIRSKGGDLLLHTALNVLLQMTGSLTMKWSHVFAEDMAVEAGLIDDVKQFPIVAHVHDELQMDVHPDQAEKFGEIYCNAIRKAGEFLKLRCPTAGEALIGKDWSETH